MRDVSHKLPTKRTARARAELFASPETIARAQVGRTPKGDPIPVARVAAALAAKKTAEWIPYCHNVPIEHVEVAFSFLPDRIQADVSVVSVAKTGVEMEAVTAAAAAVITLFDMLKMVDDSMHIGSIRLLEKTGGKSGLPRKTGWSACVVVMSDRASRGEYPDRSGAVLEQAALAHGAREVEKLVLPDDSSALREAVEGAVSRRRNLVLVTGGTGFGPRDVTHDTLAPMIERELPGVTAAYLAYSQARRPTAMLGRPLAGLIGDTVIVAVPGSPGACEDAIACLLPSLLHLFSMLAGEGHE
jgi:molybdenum cofactor biosynthesis protein MoaC